MRQHDHHSSAKAGIALLILLIGLTIVITFSTYFYDIMQAGSFNLFILLVTVAGALMLILFYLVSQAKHPAKTVKAHKSTKRTKKKR